ncbi:tagaturonate reductase [Celerinatantimonas diazotrophica]|uniref:Tagaturonate reductase n=1 Tax=Celerinatantimonas diazotrophica TaxID=412034 RepID=A0A4R1K272_9GAMM|nr:tagaturonate reductase [Celerinatantimonas diazotrophica]TCK58020.1 tagaturonate reductase [Celerinatantimonas diazotrophica]CAG9297911.1 Altronate oxidoreductase [Celerinatantimonas diazotrophica]
MKRLNRKDFPGASYPDKVIQFGEGNFLRAFVDWQIDKLNEHTSFNGGVVIIRPLDSHFPPSLNEQDGLYTTLIRGLNEAGKPVRMPRIIRSVNRELSCYQQFDEVLSLACDENIKFLFSNTTEAGINYHAGDKFSDTPPISYPAKLTRLLFERFKHFNGAKDKGFILLPCELIEHNGDQLKALVERYAKEWGLPQAFIHWLEHDNTFCSTLVDRIVTGFPGDEQAALEQEFGYQDQFIDTAEYFYLFVIEGPQSLAQSLCLHELSDNQKLNIKIVDNIQPYKDRKVAILNGAHTAMVPVAYLAGLDTVGDSMADEQLHAFVHRAIFDEIIPTLNLPKDELESFANDVLSRFKNPFIKHQLLSISLNSMTKYRTRILPQLLRFQKQHQQLPKCLTFALAALLAFYRGERHGQPTPLKDDEKWLTFFSDSWEKMQMGELSYAALVSAVLSDSGHWEQDLTLVPGLAEQVTESLQQIVEKGVREALTAALRGA